MKVIEHYQPEFVLSYAEQTAACQCLACQKLENGWPHADRLLSSQRRDSLNPGCEAVARELLLNPHAFVLYISSVDAQEGPMLTPWSEILNQQCINLATHPSLSLEGSLYAIGVLLSKAQHYVDEGQTEPDLLVAMGDQLSILAEQGIIAEQLRLLPAIENNCLTALTEMGTMRLSLNLPTAEKMAMMLKLSELAILPQNRLSERLHELQQSWEECSFFTEHPYVLRNILIYKLYQDVFPGIDCQNYGAAFLTLARQFFQLKMLSAIWIFDYSMFSPEQVVTLYSAWFHWQHVNPTVEDAAHSADFSLLTGFSLL